MLFKCLGWSFQEFITVGFPIGDTSSNLWEELKGDQENQLDKYFKTSSLSTEDSHRYKWGMVAGSVAAQKSPFSKDSEIYCYIQNLES